MSSPCAAWEPIESFRSPGEFERFRSWISGFVEEGAAERVPVEPAWQDANPLFEEWYRCGETGLLWRLIAPDPPSRGCFVRLGPRD
ncbi:MAG: hypothetical protein ACRDPC_18825 [Solirubrobacteraceae bacterium]